MEEQKIGEYAYVAPETEAEKELHAKKHPKDRLLSVKRIQSYEVTLQDMFAMRQHYKTEALSALKNAVLSLRDYKSGMVQVKTWEEQITKAMGDLPDLANNNELQENEVVTPEMVREFEDLAVTLETRFNDMSTKDMVKDDEHLEALK